MEKMDFSEKGGQRLKNKLAVKILIDKKYERL